jgi:hypothetical protein
MNNGNSNMLQKVVTLIQRINWNHEYTLGIADYSTIFLTFITLKRIEWFYGISFDTYETVDSFHKYLVHLKWHHCELEFYLARWESAELEAALSYLSFTNWAETKD